MALNRKLTAGEKRLLDFLIKKANLYLNDNWNDLLVTPLNDGGMGSLLLIPPNMDDKLRAFGSQVSQCTFSDKDGVDVIASLNLDKTGNLYELDIWKTDFSHLIEIPHNFD